MKTVFLSGSRKISLLNKVICSRLDNMAANQLKILIGDANGADKAMQKYLNEINYRNVIIYFVGKVCRNNIGNWLTENISHKSNRVGREFYALKDRAMAAKADLGFVVWDGESLGSISNVLELLKLGKKSVVYLAPAASFFTVASTLDATNLIQKCGSEAASNLSDRLGDLGEAVETRQEIQDSFAF